MLIKQNHILNITTCCISYKKQVPIHTSLEILIWVDIYFLVKPSSLSVIYAQLCLGMSVSNSERAVLLNQYH